MTFTTLTFLVYLVTLFVAYWSLRHRQWQNALLVSASYFFYAWWDYRYCALMAASSLIDFAIGLSLDRAQGVFRRRILLTVSIVSNLALLGFFKYFNFFAESLAAALLEIGWTVQPITLKIVLPVGISFYTFQTMSYTIDVYRRQLKPTRNLLEYLTFVSFFPQLVAGPIERAVQLLPQFRRRRDFDEMVAADGCRQILWGFFKKLVIADRLGVFVDQTFADVASVSGVQFCTATVVFALQIYCDFSAYSDIALGTARLFGIQLTRNFAYPYFSRSVSEFWRRWHISLSSWFRDYVFIPLGGSRVGKSKLARNILLTFSLSGLWHGASWNFVVWGGLMGLAIVVETLLLRPEKTGLDQFPGGNGILPSTASALRMAATFSLVCLGWTTFRSTTLLEPFTGLQSLGYEIWHGEALELLAAMLRDSAAQKSLALIAALLSVEWLQRKHPYPLCLPPRVPFALRWAIYSTLFWIMLFNVPEESGSFIYFQF